MTSRKPSTLDLFMLARDENDLNTESANELLNQFHKTLASIDRDYQTKGCKCVLDGLAARKRHVLHDLAVLCYEAIAYIENRTGRK